MEQRKRRQGEARAQAGPLAKGLEVVPSSFLPRMAAHLQHIDSASVCPCSVNE